jgi:2-polyprenyl-6-methoxyphenol hydroxylase-like FAD-dependent oxidoreductase
MTGSHTNSCDVLIAGAGPTGLTLACDLARRDVRVRVVDRARTHFPGSRGKGLQPRSLEVFDDLGIVEAIRAGGVEHLPIRSHHDGVVVSDADPYADRVSTPDVPYPCRLVIPQWRVESILRERLAAFGVTVELGTTFVGVTQDEHGVSAELAGPGGSVSTATARYLVGCDGGHSAVRTAVGLRLVGETSAAETMILGDVEVSGLPGDRMYMWVERGRGFLALCPFAGSRSWQVQIVVPPDAEGKLPAPSLAEFRRLFAAIAGERGVTLDRPTWLSTYRVNVRMVERYQVGRVLVAGDAAHVHSPAGGLGMNTGVQDAYNLGWKLAMVLAGEADAGLLGTYEEERLPIAAWTLGFSTDQLALIDRSLPAGGGWPRDDAGAASQLGLHYRGGSLASDHRADGDGLRAGDRAPDAPCLDAGRGTDTRLFDLFRGPHFTALGRGPGGAAALRRVADRHRGLVVPVLVGDGPRPGAGVAQVVDTGGHIERAYGAGDSLVLVRPDGYIGLVADPADDEAVSGYLRGIGARGRSAVA